MAYARATATLTVTASMGSSASSAATGHPTPRAARDRLSHRWTIATTPTRRYLLRAPRRPLPLSDRPHPVHQPCRHLLVSQTSFGTPPPLPSRQRCSQPTPFQILSSRFRGRALCPDRSISSRANLGTRRRRRRPPRHRIANPSRANPGTPHRHRCRRPPRHRTANPSRANPGTPHRPRRPRRPRHYHRTAGPEPGPSSW